MKAEPAHRDLDARTPLGLLIEDAEEEGASQGNLRRADGDRAADLQDIVRRVRPHFAAAGITRVAEVTGLDRIGIPVALAVRPNARSLSVSQGKGFLRDEAVVSAVMESLELAAAERLPETLHWASLFEMSVAGTSTIALDLSTRCRLDRIKPGEMLAWVQGYDLCANRIVNVPWSLVGVDYRPDPAGYHGAFQVSTDGLASGVTFPEAIFHGLCELIERDAGALLELMPTAELSRRVASIGAADGAEVLRAEQMIRSAGFVLTLIDMTTDIGIPAFTAIITDSAMANAPCVPRYAHSAGSACHPARPRAIMKAIAEAAQSRITRITGSRDDLPPELYQMAEGAERKAIVDLLSFAGPSAGPPSTRPGSAIPAGVRPLVAQLLRHGIQQVVAVPIKNSFGISVVRMIVPGLQTEIAGPRSKLSTRALATLIGRLH